MNIRWFHRVTAVAILALGVLSGSAVARTKDPLKAKDTKGGSEQLQRTPRSVFDQQTNIVSNFAFAISA